MQLENDFLLLSSCQFQDQIMIKFFYTGVHGVYREPSETKISLQILYTPLIKNPIGGVYTCDFENYLERIQLIKL